MFWLNDKKENRSAKSFRTNGYGKSTNLNCLEVLVQIDYEPEPTKNNDVDEKVVPVSTEIELCQEITDINTQNRVSSVDEINELKHRRTDSNLSLTYHTDDSDCEDEYSDGDEFESSLMKISTNDGIVSFEFYSYENEESTDLPMDVSPSVSTSSSVSSYLSAASLSTLDTIENHEKLTNVGDAHYEGEVEHLKNEEWQNNFELAATNHRKNDEIIFSKQKNEARDSVLKVALEAYRKTPQEMSNSLKLEKKSKDSIKRSEKGAICNGDVDKKKDKRIGSDSLSDSRKQSVKKAFSFDEESTLLTDGSLLTKKLVKVVQVKLQPEDELHASPCQCALSLMGMRSSMTLPSQISNFDSLINTDLDGEETTTQYPNIHLEDTFSPREVLHPLTPKCTKSKRLDISTPHSPSELGTISISTGLTSSKTIARDTTTSSSTIHPKSPRDALMSRTSSGQAQAIRLRKTSQQTSSKSLSAERNQMLLGGPPSEYSKSNFSSSSHTSNSLNMSGLSLPPYTRRKPSVSLFPKLPPSRASESPSFRPIDYHEITIIRSYPYKQSFSREEIEDDDDKRIIKANNWRAITIRCGDHDEMDLLLQELKQSSRSKIIPFSPNPKAKLKKRKPLSSFTKSSKCNLIRKSSASTNMSTNIRSASNDLRTSPSKKHDLFHNLDSCEICSEPFTLLKRRHHCRKCFKSCCSSCSSIHTTRKGGSEKKKTRSCIQCHDKEQPKSLKRPASSHKFNNNDYCELCTLHFTLLTRRHHCRKCDRSCCSNCSSVILVRGGEVTRFCNKCKTKLRHYSGRNEGPSSLQLPGKVHESCMNLGVGIAGKLPYWKNFVVNQDVCPAVGRLSVEINEAIALPSVDLNGHSDPYVRATITGYDYDLKWNLREWFSHKRFSLNSSYCSGTSSPVWMGSGKKGGELLTLPVISTSGAILRLEVMHFDVMKSSREKDTVLGVVEIPLSDLPNANLRQCTESKNNEPSSSSAKSYDGFVDRWYRLRSKADVERKGILLAVPMEDPRKASQNSSKNLQKPTNEKTRGLPSWQEIGQKAQGLFVAPVDWISSALNLDIPRNPVNSDYHRRSQCAAIHVRLKLNASELGDLLSHAWFPPIRPKPEVPPYEPQVLWSNIRKVFRELDPYLKIIKFFEDTIKWKHEPRVCIMVYLLIAMHIFLIHYLLLLLHLYLLVFLNYRLNKIEINNTMRNTKSNVNVTRKGSEEIKQYQKALHGLKYASVDSLDEKKKIQRSNSIDDNVSQKNAKNDEIETYENEDSLNKTVSWIAKLLGENRGLEVAQYKLEMFHHDIRNINSLWDGSSKIKTETTIAVICFSLILHCLMDRRKIWILGVGMFHFGNSPWTKLKVRMIWGFNRGMSQIMKRRTLHAVELHRGARVKF